MRGRLLAGLLALTLFVAGGADAGLITPRIVNGVYTSLFPSTGALLDGGDFNTAFLTCSGTLIGCQTFLTAGHCVEGNLNPAAYSVFFQHAGFFHVASIALHPTFNFPVGDVAVLKLTTPVTGIAPTPIDDGTPPPFGTPATIAGFGRSGSGSDYGLKRYGAVTTGSCPAGVSSTTSLCWTFANPLGSPGSNSDTCNGDSGGPLFIAGGSAGLVAGITSGGDSVDCQPTDHSYDANVAFYASYIDAQGGADLANTACGTIPQAGGPDSEILPFIGTVSTGTPEGRHSFTVPPGIGLLRVAMNALDDGASDFDLYVRAGSPPTTTTYDCRQYGSNQYGFCEFPAPAPGTWHVLVNRFAGGGTYQVTASLFGTDCSAPGSDGNACDDGNVCTTGDVCQAGACVGTPATGPACNDGSVCTVDDTCQNGTCTGTPLQDGTPCDDGHICTQNDTCQAGACVSGAGPANGCKRPTTSLKGMFQLKKDPFDSSHDRLTWKWASGAQTSKQEFGNPLATTAYGLCVYDQTAGVSQLVMERTIPAGTPWVDSPVGFKYSDRTLANAGMRALTLKSGIDGRASIAIRGQGSGLGMTGLPLHQDSTVTVQLVNGTACWEAKYSTHLLNDAAQFKARAD